MDSLALRRTRQVLTQGQQAKWVVYRGIDVGELPSGGGDEGYRRMKLWMTVPFSAAFALNRPSGRPQWFTTTEVDAGVVTAAKGRRDAPAMPCLRKSLIHCAELAGMAGVGKATVGYQPFRLDHLVPFGKCATTRIFEVP